MVKFGSVRRLGYERDVFQAARANLYGQLMTTARIRFARPLFTAPLIVSKSMKDKFSINIRFVLGFFAIGCIGLGGTAFAQNPKMFPTATPSGSSSSERDTVKSKSNKGAKLSSADKAFIKDAAKGGMMEVAMGRVAENNATDSEVKKFGARMVRDHGKANEELKSIAKEENVELPAEEEPGKWKSDKDYMDTMVKDHEKDLAAFEKEAKNGTDADVKRFASKTAKVVREHLEMAKEIDAKLK